MPTGFSEGDAFGRMSSGASGGNPTAGYLAGYFRQKRRKAGKEIKKSQESTIDFENRAKLAQFQTGLNMTAAEQLHQHKTAQAQQMHQQAGQMLIAGHLSKKELNEQTFGHTTKLTEQKNLHETEASKLTHEQALALAEQKHGHAINQVYAEHGAKSAAEKDVYSHKLGAAREYNQDLISQVGGIHNRSFETNISTGATKFGVPVKGIEPSSQFEGLPVAERDDTPQNLDK